VALFREHTIPHGALPRAHPQVAHRLWREPLTYAVTTPGFDLLAVPKPTVDCLTASLGNRKPPATARAARALGEPSNPSRFAPTRSQTAYGDWYRDDAPHCRWRRATARSNADGAITLNRCASMPFVSIVFKSWKYLSFFKCTPPWNGTGCASPDPSDGPSDGEVSVMPSESGLSGGGTISDTRVFGSALLSRVVDPASFARTRGVGLVGRRSFRAEIASAVGRAGDDCPRVSLRGTRGKLVGRASRC
jgi:hypothetical protein